MKKMLLALIMGVIMIGFASCGGNDGHSKAFRESKKILDNIKSQVEKAKDCDEVDMAAFGILGLFGVEGIEDMSEAEQEELSKISDEIDKVMADKKAKLGCPEDDFDLGDDDDWDWLEEDDMPADEEMTEE